MSKKLSIIVPVYNVSNYLEECLDSLLKQEIDDYEVIMIDDGSTDNSYEIVEEYAKRYDNFHGYTKKNQGLGHSRNMGAELATGDYITFVDSDDIIPNASYYEMLKSLEKTNSDFVIGNVIRFNSSVSFESVLHTNVFKENYESINITTHPELLYDTTAWNKVYQMSFWRKHDFKFPEGMLYEDIPVTIPGHLLADNVDVLTKTTYLWRARDEGDQSITQQRSDIKNLGDRLKAIQMVIDFMDKNPIDSYLRDAYDFKNLNMDFQIYLNYLKDKNPEFNEMLLTYLQNYLTRVSEETILKLPVMKRLKYRLLMNNELEKFIDLVNKETRKEIDFKPVKIGNIYTYNFPYMETLSEEEKSANDVFETRTRIEKVYWKSESILSLKGFAYITTMDTSSKTRFKLSLINEETGARYSISDDYKPLQRKDVRTMFGVKAPGWNPIKRLYNYLHSGFEFEIDISSLSPNFIGEFNYVLIEVVNDGVSVTNKLRSPVAGYISRPQYKIKEFISFKPNYNSFWEFKLSIAKVSHLITDIKSSESDIIISGKINPKHQISGKALFFETRFLNQSNQFIKEKIKSISSIHEESKFEYIFDKQSLDFTNQVVNYSLIGTEDYILDIRLVDKILDFNPIKGINISYSDHNEPVLTVTDFESVINNVKFNDNQMSLSVKVSNNSGFDLQMNQVYLVLTDSNDNTQKFKAIKRVIENNQSIYNFTIDLLTSKLPVLSEKLYKLTIELPYKNSVENKITNEILEVASLPVAFFNQGIDNFRYEKEGYRFEVRHTRKSRFAVFSQIRYWKRIEDGPRRQSVLRDVFYPLMRKLPVKNIAVYESYWGKEYSCNPQALCEYMQENRPDIKNVVFLTDGFYQVDGNVETVKVNSFKYYYYLARAKYLVNNVNFPDFYQKRKQAIEIQTMHGTPLKTLGLDSPNEIKPNFVDKYIEKNNRWDHLLIPSDYVGEIAKSAFKYNKDFVKSGYPRNDKLFRDNTQDNIDRLKEKYNVPLDRKIVLYAPTWRTKGKYSLAMDIERMSEELGEEYFLLVKLHHFSQANFDLNDYANFARDISLDSDIRELYLLADVLITDYSSVMFDYALLNKPMLFFVYDYEKYKDELRGFYFDFAAEAPGKLARTTADLIEALSDLDQYKQDYSKKYDLFSTKFNQYDKGNACEIVVNEIFTK